MKISVHEGDVYTVRQARLSLCAHDARTDVLFTYTVRQPRLGRVSKGERVRILQEDYLSLCAHDARTEGYTTKTIGVYIAKLVGTVQYEEDRKSVV